MNYLGRTVRKEFPGHGTFSGVVQSYDQSTGFFRISYQDGDSEELELFELDSLLVSSVSFPVQAPQPSNQTQERFPRNPGRPKKRPRVVGKGKGDDNSVIDGDIHDNFVDSVSDSGELNLNSSEGVDLNDPGLNILHDNDHGVYEAGGGIKLSGLGLNHGSSPRSDLDEGIREISLCQRKQRSEDLNGEIDGILNLQLMGDEAGNSDGCLRQLEACNTFCVKGDGQPRKELMTGRSTGVSEEGEMWVADLYKENKDGITSKGCENGVYTENRTQLRASREIKDSLDVELAAFEAIIVDRRTGNLKTELKNNEETPLGKNKDSVDHDDRDSSSRLRGRGWKRKEFPENNNGTLSTSDTKLRRSSHRADTFPDHALKAAGLEGINFQFSSSADCVVYDENILVPGPQNPLDHNLLPKVDLPPSSCNLDLGKVSMFDVLSIYAFLRSFSTLLFLSPFEVDDFVASIKCNDSTLLLDSIHVSLLRTIRKHLESLVSDGSMSASNCLRSLNWDYVDLITWPMFVIEYLLFHSPGHIPGLDLCHLKPFQIDYYKLPASTKVEILRHLCDDVIEVDAFRSELNKRSSAPERQMESDSNVKFSSSKKRKTARDFVSTPCLTKEDDDKHVDWNSDECCLCKMDGNLICCDGCPAAFHSRCVGVASNLLPEGDWYCPECTIDKSKPWMKVGKSSRGTTLLGVDPYGRLYYSSCGYLIVLESCEDQCSFWLYDRYGLPPLIEALESSPFIYDLIISSICKHWNLIHEVDGNKHVNVLDTENHEVKLELRSAQFEGSSEVSQSFIRTDCSQRNTDISSGTQLPETLSSAGYVPPTINSREVMSQMHSLTSYVNCYEFARTASSVFEDVMHKLSNGITRSMEEVVAAQLKAVSNIPANFNWANIENSYVNFRKEKCGWCFYCKFTEEGRDCLLITNDFIPAVDNFTSEALGVQVAYDRKKHLTNIMCHVIYIEDHLHGLLLGPWLNPHYSVFWRRCVLEVSNIASLKNLLLKLEANLHRRALSADWQKTIDSVPTMGSATYFANSSVRVSSKLGTIRKELGLFWWRGGRSSRNLFNYKVIPYSLASKAARQGGLKKIAGILYPDSGEYARRTKCNAWRAAVERSKSVEQLSLQVRELDANIKWGEIGNYYLPLKMDNEFKKSLRSFKKAVIRRRSSEGTVLKYLLDFGKRRFIPDIVVKQGSIVEDSTGQRKKYWLEDAHVPLHLLKAFEEKRISRRSNVTSFEKLCGNSRIIMKPLMKGFQYLFSKAKKLGNNQCGHCNRDVRIREAVSCEYCEDGKLVQTHARKRKSKSSKTKHVSVRLKPLQSRQGKKLRNELLQVNSKNTKRPPLVITLRRSARRAERMSKLPFHNSIVIKRKKRSQTASKQGKLMRLKNNCRHKKRTPRNSSYWLNGLLLSRKPNDERLLHFKSKMLVILSEQVISSSDRPTCSLCREMEHTFSLTYVACQLCQAWYHGDALDLSAEKIANLVGFKCYRCLNKKSPVCPYDRPTANYKTEPMPKNNVVIKYRRRRFKVLPQPEERSTCQKSQSRDESDHLSFIDSIEKNSSG